MAHGQPTVEITISRTPGEKTGLYFATATIHGGPVAIAGQSMGTAYSRNPRQAVAFALEELGTLIQQRGIHGVPDLTCSRCNAVHLQSAFELLPAAVGGALQHVDATDTEPAEVHEVRNCTCGSTIARRIS